MVELKAINTRARVSSQGNSKELQEVPQTETGTKGNTCQAELGAGGGEIIAAASNSVHARPHADAASLSTNCTLPCARCLRIRLERWTYCSPVLQKLGEGSQCPRSRSRSWGAESEWSPSALSPKLIHFPAIRFAKAPCLKSEATASASKSAGSHPMLPSP